MIPLKYIVLSIAFFSTGCGLTKNPKFYEYTISNMPGHLIVNSKFGDNVLLVSSYGSAPELIGIDRIKGSGFDIKVINTRKKDIVFAYLCSEAEWDIILDFSRLNSGTLQLIELTWDPRKENKQAPPTDFTIQTDEKGNVSNQVPFVEVMIQITQKGEFTFDPKILLDAEKADAKKINELTEHACKDRKNTEQYDFALAHLRNMAIDDPDAILKAYEIIGESVSKPSYSAAGLEILDDYKDEVEWIKQIKGKENENKCRLENQR